MVLNKYVVCVVWALSLAGCSALTTTDSSHQQVIPAYSDPDESPNEVQVSQQEEDLAQGSGREAIEVIKMDNQGRNALNIEPNEPAVSAPAQPQVDRPDIPYPLIVQSLIARAEKAISMQQWLRAQHILEQGIHIAPRNAKVFLIYGDVYLNLGILAKAEQMYRRAIALAGDSTLGRLANNKLDALTAGN